MKKNIILNEVILKFRPYFSHTVWGGSKLAKLFNENDNENKIGEAWVISAIKHKESVCYYPNEMQGKTLTSIFKNKPELFNHYEGEYPHLVKFIDAHKDLSVQVHPNDKYAKKHNNSLGKTECWYVLDAKAHQEIILGHNAQTKTELKKMVADKNWKELLTKIKIKKNDFIYVPTGAVHALTANTCVCEIQQSSDVTYRFYDYDRLGLDGKPRELHIQDSLAVTTCPQSPESLQLKAKGDSKYLVNNNLFKIRKLTSKTPLDITKASWTEIICVNGNGKINGATFSYGDAAIFTYGTQKISIEGNLVVLAIIN